MIKTCIIVSSGIVINRVVIDTDKDYTPPVGTLVDDDTYQIGDVYPRPEVAPE